MPLFEYQCPHCKSKIERYLFGRVNNPLPICGCGAQMEQVEFSVPAKRDPEKGIQK